MLKVEVVMRTSQSNLGHRPPEAPTYDGVRNQARNGFSKTGGRNMLQNDTLRNSRSSRNADVQPRDFNDAAVSSAKLEGMKSQPLTIMVADDHPMVREGLITIINRQPDMRVVAEAANGREAVEQFMTLRPDVALVDLRMPMMGGIDVVMSIYERVPAARLVVVTTYQTEEDIYRALQAGARGYVLKDAPLEDIVECIHAVGSGKTWIPPAVGAKLAMRVTDRALTARELEVIRALAKGKSNKEIGVALNISEGTVKVHVTHMLEKLKVTGRTEAIAAAVKRGLVTID
jgi:DNA-binding NarL/FixJ family response regulator